MNKKQSFIRPKVEQGRHPIETTRYLLGTSTISRFYECVCQWIDNRVPGGLIYGKPRYGKTRSISYLMKLLPERFGDSLPVISLSSRDYRTASESVFFEDLLRAAGHALSHRGNASAKRNRLREFLFEKVSESGQDRIVLFVDEAQKLHEMQYNWLIDLHNELDSAGVNMIIFLVGQPELTHQHSAFVQSGKAQIIGRFMVNQLEFRGLCSSDDIAVCLDGFDDGTEYPPGSGWSFSRYFFPAVFASGWRLIDSADSLWESLAEYSEELWEVLIQINEKTGFVGNANILMQ